MARGTQPPVLPAAHDDPADKIMTATYVKVVVAEVIVLGVLWVVSRYFA